MKLILTGLALLLASLANPALSAEVTVYSPKTGLQTLPMPEPIRVPGNPRLILMPRETVMVPSPFDVAPGRFQVCVASEQDAPALFLSMPDYLANEPVELETQHVASVDQNCRHLQIDTNPNQIGKIVTLLLAPE